jgi:curved DNA-binding protein CbpA
MNIYSCLIVRLHHQHPTPSIYPSISSTTATAHLDGKPSTIPTMPLLDSDIERDLYSELGVSRQATKQEIQDSYRTLSSSFPSLPLLLLIKLTSPKVRGLILLSTNRNPSVVLRAEEERHLFNRAFAILTNDADREEYDLRKGFSHPYHAQSHTTQSHTTQSPVTSQPPQSPPSTGVARSLSVSKVQSGDGVGGASPVVRKRSRSHNIVGGYATLMLEAGDRQSSLEKVEEGGAERLEGVSEKLERVAEKLEAVGSPGAMNGQRSAFARQNQCRGS